MKKMYNPFEKFKKKKEKLAPEDIKTTSFYLDLLEGDYLESLSNDREVMTLNNIFFEKNEILSRVFFDSYEDFNLIADLYTAENKILEKIEDEINNKKLLFSLNDSYSIIKGVSFDSYNLDFFDSEKVDFKKIHKKFLEINSNFSKIGSLIGKNKETFDGFLYFINNMQSLSSRTNFLSLNSAIESSFFESYKRSFFVISSGVKDLSQFNYKNSIKMFERAVEIKTFSLDSLNKSEYGNSIINVFLDEEYLNYQYIDEFFEDSISLKESVNRFEDIKEESLGVIYKNLDDIYSMENHDKELITKLHSLRSSKIRIESELVNYCNFLFSLYKDESFFIKRALFKNIIVVILSIKVLKNSIPKYFLDSLSAIFLELKKGSKVSSTSSIDRVEREFLEIVDGSIDIECMKDYLNKLENLE